MALTNSITATAADVSHPSKKCLWTVRNIGLQDVYWKRSLPDDVTFAGLAAALDILAEGILHPGKDVVLRADTLTISCVCATSLASTLETSAGTSNADGAGQLTPKWDEKANANARTPDSAVAAEVLVSSSTPYVTATVTAKKPGANATTPAGANTGNVYICSAAEVLTAATLLAPGQSVQLQRNCNLADFFLAVDTGDDGVLINYNV